VSINGEIVKPRRRKPSIRGLKLLAAVYEELVGVVGGSYSTADLLVAAQWIVDASNQEELGLVREEIGRPDYYSQDVFTAMEGGPWQVACRERLNDNCSDYRFERNWNAMNKLNRLLRGW
jgi:hypothetical protein